MPAAGSVAALTTAMAAGLVAKAARVSEEEGVALQADELRERVAPLAQADAEAYREALETLRSLPADDPGRADAFARASDIPLEIAEVATRVAELGAELAESGKPALKGEAVSASELGAACARIAAFLVTVNLEATPDDERVIRANRLAAEAAGYTK